MADREQALEQIAAIARSHDLSLADIELALTGDAAADSDQRRGLLSKILALLGGTFVFAGLSVFIALNWDAMNTAARITITLGSGLAAFVLALIAAREPRYQRLCAPLYLIAAILQPIGLLVILEDLSSIDHWHYPALAIAGIMALQQGLVFAIKRDTTLLFLTLTFSLSFCVTACDMLNMDGDLIALLLGGALLGLCIGLDNTRHRAITPFWYFVASLGVFGGLFSLLQRSPAELLFLAAACGGVFLSTYARSRVLLFVSTVAILGYISYYTSRNFLDALGWPIVLIALGLLLIALSSLAMRINKRYIAGS